MSESGVINGPDGPEIQLPLFLRQRTQLGHHALSVSCQEETHALQQTASLCLVRHRDFARRLLAPSIDPQQHDNDGAHQRATRER